MNTKAVAALLLLLQLASSLWTENLSVYAYDAKGRPLPGALVEIRYQREKFPVIGGAFDGYVRGYTGPDGGFAYVIYNQVARAQDVVGEYVVFVGYGEKFASTTVKCTALAQRRCSQEPRVEIFTLPVYQARVRVMDAKGEAVSGASVRFAETVLYTDRNGEAATPFPDGASYEALVSYGEFSEKTSGRISGNDALAEVVLPLYDVRFRIIDDSGLPLAARVKLANETKYAGANGSVEFRRVAFKNPEALVEYAEHRKSISLNLSQDVFQTVRIDLTPPALGEPVFTKSNGNILVGVEARDVGVAASGLRSQKPLLITYSPDNTTWMQAEMHVVAAGVFAATLPATLYPNATFYYRIQAFDNEGNHAEKNGSVRRVPAPAGPSLPVGGANYLYILGAIVIAIVVVLIYRKLREYF
ncbi:MAG: hypothetical protein QXH27_03600 [Candidatus Micrarchaeia archaeon]